MKRAKAFVAVLAATTMVLGLVGCGSSSDKADTSKSESKSESSSSSDLNVMLETPVESLDPQQATDGTSFEVIADYTDGLMQMDKDGKAVWAIAESSRS